MEESSEKFTNKMCTLFRERKLAKNKIPIDVLSQLIKQLEKYKKKECTEMIDALKMVLKRKKKLLLNEDYQLCFEETFWWKFSLNKDKEQAYRYLKNYNEVQGWSERDVRDGPYILDQPYSTDEEEEEERTTIRDSVVEVENIMKKGLKEFTQLLLHLFKSGKILLSQMPI